MSQENIITQVTPDSPSQLANATTNNTGTSNEDIDFNSLIHLNLRGTEFTITRDELMSLPESILLCLFPNGVFLDVNGQIISNLTEEDVVYVNFDPDCFQYIIDVFRKAQQDLVQMSSNQSNLQLSPQISSGSRSQQQHQQENILQTKPAIIVLREDLDFYVIPPIAGLNREEMRQLKKGVSVELLKNKLIFSGLGYKFEENDPVLIGEDGSIMQDANEKQDNNNGKGLGAAEQHLFDMLCSSGFETKDKWGSRSLEPGKCVISSLSLVRLKTEREREREREKEKDQQQTPSETPPDSPSLTPVASHASGNNSNSNGNGNERSRSRPRSRIAQLASSASRAASRSLSSKRNNNSKVDPNQTKLLLFWRKPARKCWWSHGWITINIDVADIKELEDSDAAKLSVKVHVRRVWTLELSIIT
ncbi:Whi2 protein [Candida orthopsilosis Co 90-125]|uniref:Whi2 protein n=1 Tax=Candida orthopsilosis (strain 90-125) TaxID=1136231 RepID=H8XBL8_CANO9|nr:Whi2 protein [Candida orthopsilosis Co 90-125]CCG25206.1 Whi2 protein [Candida orthopsilosis Co 90-125]